MDEPGDLAEVYEGFVSETLDVYDTREELQAQLEKPEVIRGYASGELGKNEQLVFRALAVFNHMDSLHQIAFRAVRCLLTDVGQYDDEVEENLCQLSTFCLRRKREMLSTDQVTTATFNYEFDRLTQDGFDRGRVLERLPEGKTIRFYHSDSQRELIPELRRHLRDDRLWTGDHSEHSRECRNVISDDQIRLCTGRPDSVR